MTGTDILVAEDLLLLLLDDESGRVTNGTYLDVGLGGALLVDLALAGQVEVAAGTGFWARAKVRPTGAPAPTDPVLQQALALVAERERSAQDLVARLGRRRRDVLLERLAQRGILQRQHGTVLGLFPRERWPARDGTHESDVRRRLGDALVRGSTPDDRTAALVGLLHAMGIVHKVLDRDGLSAGEVRRRAKAIAEGDWAAKAVRDAVAAAQAAVASAAVVATTAATTSG